MARTALLPDGLRARSEPLAKTADAKRDITLKTSIT